MNFFKKKSSSKKNNEETSQKNETSFLGFASKEAFYERYTEDKGEILESMFEGSLKMIESYFIDNQITRVIPTPINHPKNLDQMVKEGMGFHAYCKAFNLGDIEVVSLLAMGFNEFMINNHEFRLYQDKTPEFPLRGMTLKLDVNNSGYVISLYPIEYSLKVLNHEADFEQLYAKIKQQLEIYPQTKQNIDSFLRNQSES